MKLTKFANLLVIGLVLAVAASGCKKKPVGVTQLPNPYTKNPTDKGSAAPLTDNGGRTTLPTGPITTDVSHPPVNPIVNPIVNPTGTPSNSPDTHAGWPEDRSILKADTVYFDFDSSAVKASEKPKVAAVVDYLKANAATAVKIEGNCDERGTEEYNRSLGERRALAVREELIRLGIDATRVDTTSFGKDKPEDPGHDEAAWKKNRRDDFVVLTPPAK